MPCYHPLGGYAKPSGGLTFKKSESNGNKMEVACGSCLGCRLEHARHWGARICHEATQHKYNSFITLTYRDQFNCSPEQLRKGHHINKWGTLNKEDFKKFIKRLRQDRIEHPECYTTDQTKNLRYFHCGEYGELLSRPHYHALLFNCEFADEQLFRNRDGVQLYRSETLERLWPYGFASVGELTYESAAYCARYSLKKITGDKANDHYLRCDEYGVAYWLQPEYITMSRRPGIGAKWYAKYKRDMFPSDETPVPGYGIIKGVPRYYSEMFRSENPDAYKDIQRARQCYKRDNPEEFSPERLRTKFLVKQSQIKSINPRNLS